MKITLGTYEDLIKIMGDNIKNSSLAKRIKNGTAKYYLIFDGDNIIDSFWIFINYLDKTIADLCIYQNQNKSLFYNKELMNLIFKKLKEDGYKKVKQQIYKTFPDKIELSKEYGFEEELENSLIGLIKDL